MDSQALTVTAVIAKHYMLFLYLGLSAVVAAVSALNPPGHPDGGVYGWFYRFTQALLPLAQRYVQPPAGVNAHPATTSLPPTVSPQYVGAGPQGSQPASTQL